MDRRNLREVLVPKTYLALECREPFSSARPTQAQGARDWTRCPDLSLPSHLCNLRGPGSGHSTSSQDIPEPPDPVRFLPDAPLFFPGRSALCWRCRAEPTSEETPAAALGLLGQRSPPGHRRAAAGSAPAGLQASATVQSPWISSLSLFIFRQVRKGELGELSAWAKEKFSNWGLLPTIKALTF